MCVQAYIFKCTIRNAERHPKQLRLKQFLYKLIFTCLKTTIVMQSWLKPREQITDFLKKFFFVIYLSLFKLISWKTILLLLYNHTENSIRYTE